MSFLLSVLWILIQREGINFRNYASIVILLPYLREAGFYNYVSPLLQLQIFYPAFLAIYAIPGSLQIRPDSFIILVLQFSLLVIDLTHTKNIGCQILIWNETVHRNWVSVTYHETYT